MKPSREQLEAIFEAAAALQTDVQRQEYLDRACPDSDLRKEVESLLAAMKHPESLFETQDETTTVKLDSLPVLEQPGTVIGRYKLLQKVGIGGMGVVYMAEQTEPVKRKVALKIIKLGMDTKQVVARFEAERQALAMMDHPNIAKVLDAGSTDTGRPYFVMELVRGVPITEYCDKNKLSTKERLELFLPVCQAIQHAHQKGVIHRDIKPSNVMVTLNEGIAHPMVIDFGIAKATNQNLTEKTLFTNYAQMLGTPAYMAPEQAEMSKLDVDTRTDVYSLGVLLYELLTGTTPFPIKELMSKGYGEMQRIITEQEPPKPSTRLSTMLNEERSMVAKNRSMEISAVGRAFQGDLDWIVMKALEKDRIHRYETVNGFASDIRRHLNDELVTAAAPTFGYQLRKFARRNQKHARAAAVVAVLLLISTLFSFLQMVKVNKQVKLTERAKNEADQKTVEAVEALEELENAEADLKRRWAASRIAEVEALQLTRGAGVVTNALPMVKEVMESDVEGLDLPQIRTLALRSLGAIYQRDGNPVEFEIPEKDLLEAVAHGDLNSIAFGYEDGSIRWFDVFSGKEMTHARRAHLGSVESLRYLPSDDCWVSCDPSGRVIIWEQSTADHWAERRQFELGPLQNEPTVVAGHPGFLVHAWGSSTFWRWSSIGTVEPERIEIPFKTNGVDRGPWRSQIPEMVVSPDGRLLWLNEEPPDQQGRRVQAWDLEAKELIDPQLFSATLSDKESVSVFRFNPDGSLLAVGDMMREQVSVYQMSPRKLLFRSPVVGFPYVDFSSNGKYMICGFNDKQIMDVHTGEDLSHIEDVAGYPRFEPDSQAWASVNHRGAEKWSVERWQAGEPSLVARLDHSRGSNGMAISKDMRWVASSQGRFNHWNSGIWLEDMHSGEKSHLESGIDSSYANTTEDPTFSVDSRLVASCVGSRNKDVPGSGRILIWETDSKKLICTEPFGHANGMVKFHPKKQILAAVMGRKLAIWSYRHIPSSQTQAAEFELKKLHQEDLDLKGWNVCWDAGGTILVWTEGGEHSSGNLGIVHAMNAETGQRLALNESIGSENYSVAATEHPGEILFLAAEEKTGPVQLQLWNVIENKQLLLPTTLGSGQPVSAASGILRRSLSKDPTGRYVTLLVEGPSQREIVLYDYHHDCELLRIPNEQKGTPFSVQWSSDGKTVGLVYSSGGKIELWNIPEMRRKLEPYDLDWED
jgi:WD40 repeat protein